MKREERYCDICGTRITGLHEDGDQYKEGIELNVDKAFGASLSLKTTCGMGSKSEWLRGIEFCSVTCFEKSVNDWMDRIKGLYK